MKNEIDGGIQLMEQGGADTLPEKRNCSEGAFSGPANTVLDRQALCVNHFLVRCYEWLDRIDPGSSRTTSATARSFCRIWIRELQD